MGLSGSSSRRKSSKKKSLKAYRKKKSRRRNKSKKLRRSRHHDDSFSSSSDGESSQYSSSSSDSEYKSKRSRSHSRNESKKKTKRSRIRSSTEDDSSPVKRRKKLKTSKKTNKSKKDGYISSASSDSESCSTCNGDSSRSRSSDAYGRSRRGRSRQKEKGHRGSNSTSKLSDCCYDNESVEKVRMESSNPMRLKSVITVANLENKEDENMKKEEPKEETVYDYDDYPPSCKSNESNEFVTRSDISPEKKEITSKEANSASIVNDSKKQESGNSGNIRSEVDDLESILRQKALENLSRFQGRLKSKPVVAVDSEHKSDQSGVVKQPTSASTTPVSHPAVHRTRFTWRRHPTEKDEKAATYSGSQPDGIKRPSADLSSTSRVENAGVNETSKVMVDTNDVDQNATAFVAPSTANTEEGCSKEQQTESNDNSQFEKKTMSVMRGGEMVQVSYKVYIPNRAPALTRRQLKR